MMIDNSWRFLLIGANADDRTLILNELHRVFPNLHLEQINEASDFDQALMRGDFDLVIIADGLNWTDGPTLLRRLKTRYPNRPVILLTDASAEDSAIEALKTGLGYYVLRSPEHLSRLAVIVQSGLEQAQQYRRLAEAEARYRSLVDGVPVGLYRTTPDGQILDANPALAQMLGYPDRATLLGANVRDFYVDPGERVRWQALLEKEGQVRNFETRQARRDGRIIWMRDSAQVVRDEQGQILYYEGFLEDVTERKQAQVAEREQRELAETLQEVTLALASQTDRSAVLDEILHQAQRLVPFNTANIMLLEGDVLRIARWQGYDAFEGREFISTLVHRLADFPLDAEAVQTRKPVVIPDVRQEPRWVPVDQTAWIRSYLVVPIYLGDRVLGLLRLDGQTPGKFSAQDGERLLPLAHAAAIALENARLLESSQRQSQELSSLYDTALATGSILETEALLAHISEQVRQLMSPDSFGVFRYDEDSDEFEIVLAIEAEQRITEAIGRRVPLAEGGLTGWIIQTRQALLVGDLEVEQLPIEPKHLTQPARAWLGVPLIAHDHLIGAISVQSFRPYAFDDNDCRFLESLAAQMAVAIENAQLFEATGRQAREMKIISDILRSLNATPDVVEAFPAVSADLKAIAGCERVSLVLFDGTQQWLTVVALDRPHDEAGQGLRMPVSDSALATNVLVGKPLFIPDLAAEMAYPLVQALYQAGYRSSLGLPLRVGERVIGGLNLGWYQPNACDLAHLPLLGRIADAIALALERSQLFDETRRQAEQLEALHQVSQGLILLRGLDAVLGQLAERAVQLLGGTIGGVGLYRPGREVLESVAIVGEELPPAGLTLRRGEGVAGKVWETGQPVIVHDYENWPDKSPQRSELGASVIGVPIQWGDEFLGVLTVADKAQRRFTEADVTFLSQFATQAAIAIQNARLYDQVQRHAAELEERISERAYELRVLYELSQQIGYTLSYDELSRLVLTHLYRVVPYDVAGICLLTPETFEVYLQSRCPLPPDTQAEIEERLSTTMAGLSERQLDRQQITTKFIESDVFGTTAPPLEKLGSFFQVSLIMDGETIGVLFVSFGNEDQFTGDRIRFTYTAANQATQAIQRLRNVLAAEQQRLENLVAHLPEGVLLVNDEGRILVSNPAGYQIMAALNPAAAGDVLTHLGPYSLATILARHIEPLPIEIILDGFPQRVFEVEARPISTAEQQWVLTLREVTHERQNELKLQAQERLATVGQLAAGIAHDFNNILTSIIGFAELVRLDPNLADTSSHDLERIIQQGQRAARLVRQILDFSRQSIAEKQQLDLAFFLKETFKLLQRTIPETIHLTLEIEPGCEDCCLHADPAQLQQVLTNLALNARDAITTSGTLHFHLSQFVLEPTDPAPCPEMRPGQWLAISLTDSGSGISPKILPHIFEPFYTTKEVGKGTGLGLAQVYGIIKQHGGCIDVISQEGKGSTFTLFLPPSPSLPEALSEVRKDKLTRGSGELLLVVEDEPRVLEVIQAMLTQLGYRVLTATNGREALAVYDRQQDNIALVLTDVTMPGMDGLALAQALQAQDPTVKVVVLTGYPRGAADRELLAQGVVDWLQKPISIDQLAWTVSRLLGE